MSRFFSQTLSSFLDCWDKFPQVFTSFYNRMKIGYVFLLSASTTPMSLSTGNGCLLLNNIKMTSPPNNFQPFPAASTTISLYFFSLSFIQQISFCISSRMEAINACIQSFSKEILLGTRVYFRTSDGNRVEATPSRITRPSVVSDVAKVRAANDSP